MTQGEKFSSAYFSSRLAAEMRRRGWNQSDVARESGLSQPSIHRYLKGATEPKLSDVMALAGAFKLSLDDFAGHAIVETTVREAPPRYSFEDAVWKTRALAAEKKIAEVKKILAADATG